MRPHDHTAPVPTDAAASSRVLGERYLLEERIASGGMATVWRAHDEMLARTVAIKILHEHMAADDAIRERFRREAVAAAKLGHPGVVAIYDTGEEPGRTYLVMEYVDGKTLRAVLSDQDRLEVTQAAAIGHRVAGALAYAHRRGLVHRDVKPANILVADDGTVKIADFGIAKAAQEARDLTQTGIVLGTAAYVAPEQVRGEPVDGAADQYALACVVYEAISGSRPFESESAMTMATRRLEEDALPLRSLRPNVPPALDEVVMRALARSPTDRYPDIASFGDALAPWSDDQDKTTPDALTEPEEPPDAPEDAGSKPSFLRSEGTWLTSVLALLAVAATLIAMSLASGLLEPVQIPQLTASDEEGNGIGPSPDDSPTVGFVDLDADDLDSFDPPLDDWPGGDGAENDDALGNLVDDDSTTTWRTATYPAPDFGGLKPGVGVVADTGTSQELAGVSLTTATAGVTFELRVADRPYDDVAEWDLAAEVTDGSGLIEVTFDDVEARYLLVYLRPDLPLEGGGAAAELAELAIRNRQ